jgi:hypothetical protein
VLDASREAYGKRDRKVWLRGYLCVGVLVRCDARDLCRAFHLQNSSLQSSILFCGGPAVLRRLGVPVAALNSVGQLQASPRERTLGNKARRASGVGTSQASADRNGLICGSGKGADSGSPPFYCSQRT